MATTQSRLLGLPPELRHKIYSYLGRRCEVTTPLPLTPDAKSQNQVRVYFINGPDSEFLSSCKRLSKEYEREWPRKIVAEIWFGQAPPEGRISFKKTFPGSLLQRATTNYRRTGASGVGLTPTQFIADVFIQHRAEASHVMPAATKLGVWMRCTPDLSLLERATNECVFNMHQLRTMMGAGEKDSLLVELSLVVPGLPLYYQEASDGSWKCTRSDGSTYSVKASRETADWTLALADESFDQAAADSRDRFAGLLSNMTFSLAEQHGAEDD